MSKAPAQNAVRTQFKTPEGRYKLSHEKGHAGLMNLSYVRGPTKITFAHLKEKPQNTQPSSPLPSGAVNRFKILGSSSANGTKSLGFSSAAAFSSKFGRAGSSASMTTGASSGALSINADAEGSYLLYNVGDTIFVADYNSTDRDPIKAITIHGQQQLCHAFDSQATDGHDLLIGTSGGDVFSASLRQQLQDVGRKLVGAAHYNKEGLLSAARCTKVEWVPGGDGLFVASHADGNLFVYDKNREGNGELTFPPPKDSLAFSVAHARSSKSNPLARWHVCVGSLNEVCFSPDGSRLATVGRDGYLRVFDFAQETLLSGCKSYYGALLCCTFSPDGKYVMSGGEDDLIQVWSMEDELVVAWCEGHSSWVSGVAFDNFWEPPSTEDGAATNYRFGSVGQDTQLLLWDLCMDEVVVPLRRLAVSKPGGSTSQGPAAPASGAPMPPGPAAPRLSPVLGPPHQGVLQPPAARKDIPRITPTMAHRVHAEPLSDVLFTKDAIITACHEGHAKVWCRPTNQPIKELLHPAPAANGPPLDRCSFQTPAVQRETSKEGRLTTGGAQRPIHR